MWNRLQTAANTTTTTLIQTPSELLPHHHKRQDRRRQTVEPDELDADKRFWQDSFDSRLSGLDILDNAPYRYEICRGKTVPSPIGTSPLGSTDHLPGLVSDANTNAAPPRNPLRRRSQSCSNPRPASSYYGDSKRDHLPSPEIQVQNTRAAATPSPLGKMYSYTPHPGDAEQVSPPSSPDVNATRPGHLNHDVSPIDDDEPDLFQQQLKGPRPARQSISRPTQAGAARPQPHSRPASGHQPKSSIPMMRRERRKQSDAAAAAKIRRPGGRETGRQTPPTISGPTSWDDAASAALAARLNPAQGALHDDGQIYGCTTTITSESGQRSGTASPSLGQRMRQFGRTKPEPIESRPAWNGASGREALVSPVHDDTNVAPLTVPPKSTRRNERVKNSPPSKSSNTSPPSNPPGSEILHGGASAAAAVRRFIPSRSTPTPEQKNRSSPSTDPATRNAAPAAQSHPSPAQRSSPVPQAQKASPQTNAPPTAPSLTIPSSDKAIKRKPPPSSQANATSHAIHPSTSSSIYSIQPPELAPSSHPVIGTTPNPVVSGEDEAWVPPPSRFSITTYATSATGSPRQSNEEERPPMPEPPQNSSVMDREARVRGSDSLPVPSDDVPSDDPVVISLKGVSLSKPIIGADQDRAKRETPRTMPDIKRPDRPSSASSSTGKALPPAPPEMVESTDRVVVLNAKLNALAHRRNNINKSIKKMTELMPADRLLESAEVLRKREEEKKKVEILKEELAEIQQQEYELGLKLHRAYKRQDRDADYESGTLWVRRVTG